MQLATIKHVSSKNANYGDAESYLTFEHDEFSGKALRDKNGHLIPREEYRMDTSLCGEDDFAIACMRANLRYEKNNLRGDVKSHRYIISYDPRDAEDHGLTVDRAQELGVEFCRKNFPGHQAMIVTHPDGHNHSGNIHTHIVINSLRITLTILLSKPLSGGPDTLIHKGIQVSGNYSHSMEAGGLVVTSRTTRLTWGTSLTMRAEMRAIRS